MNKKIKLIIMIIFLLLGIGSTVHAYTPAGYFPQIEGSYTYYCKQKSGPLRFFSESLTTTEPTHQYRRITVNSVDNMDEYKEAIKTILENVKSSLADKVEQLGANVKAYKITSGTGTNYNGSFKSDPRK